MNSKIMFLPDIGEIKIKKNGRNKNINLKIKPPGIVSVSMPLDAKFQDAERFIHGKKEWIKDGLQKIQGKIKPKEIIDEKTAFKTAKYCLKFHTHNKKCVKWEIIKNVINIYYPETSDIREDFIQKCIKKAIGAALKIEAWDYLNKRLEYWSKKTGLIFKSLTLVDVKGYWGMCMGDNAIKLNVHLIRLPQELIDYIILHELTHIKVKNHSSKFYDFLATLLPNHKELSNRIKKYSPDRLLL